MNQYIKEKLKVALGLVVFVLSLVLVVLGQRRIDYPSLGLMFIGLAGLLLLLYLYNRSHTKQKRYEDEK